jgi:hypothetical protein
MEHFDNVIMKQKQYDVMHKSRHRTRVNEDQESAKMLPSRLGNIPQIGRTREQQKHTWDERRPQIRESHHVSALSNSGSLPNNSKLVRTSETSEMITVRQKLPKWLPCENKDEKDHLFTQTDYWNMVVRPLLTLPEFEANPDFSVTLSQRNLDDPSSYLLEATGTKTQLKKLLISTEKYVQVLIADSNIATLWNDANSLLLDVSIHSKAKLGAVLQHSTCRGWEDSETSIPGVWVREIKYDGALSEALGDIILCESGCMIVAVDTKNVFLSEHIETHFYKAIESSRPLVKVTLCISKYADLSRLSNSLKQNLKYRNIMVFDAKKYESVVEERNDDISLLPSVYADGVVQQGLRKEIARDLARYNLFEIKYRQLVGLEFKSTNIDQTMIIKSMWNVHKMMFGECSSCDDGCACYQATRNIIVAAISTIAPSPVERHVNVQKEMTGILEYFLPRFIDKLKKKYPRESIADLFQRAIDLWSEHEGSRLCGLRCGDDCQCEKELDWLFGQGSKASPDVFEALLRKKSTRGESFYAVQSPTDSNHPVSLGTTDSSALRFAAGKRFERESIRNSPEPKRQHFSHPSYRSQSITGPLDFDRRPFEAVFDSTKPIGGYFVTELGVDGAIGCHLFSKCANSAIAADSRIRLGSTVSAVVMGESRKEVRSHADLKLFYDHAKKFRRKLNMIIEKRGGLHGLTDTLENWTSTGNWIGKRFDGWPGGAKDESGNHRPVKMATDSSPPILQSAAPASTLQQNASQMDPLTNAVRLQTCKELIEILEFSYFPRDRTEVEKQLKPHHKFAQDEMNRQIASLANGEDGDSCLLHRIQDLKAKHIALKICICSTIEIEKAASLEAWNVIDFRVEHLKLVKNKFSQPLVKKVVAVTVKMRSPDSVLVGLCR